MNHRTIECSRRMGWHVALRLAVPEIAGFFVLTQETRNPCTFHQILVFLRERGRLVLLALLTRGKAYQE